MMKIFKGVLAAIMVGAIFMGLFFAGAHEGQLKAEQFRTRTVDSDGLDKSNTAGIIVVARNKEEYGDIFVSTTGHILPVKKEDCLASPVCAQLRKDMAASGNVFIVNFVCDEEETTPDAK